MDIHSDYPVLDNSDRKIAYFSMEVGIRSDIPTYSGGLGVLAGDTIKAFADLHVPAVAVSLLYWKGYFSQEIDAGGNQHEHPVNWLPPQHLQRLSPKAAVTLRGRTVVLQAWQYWCTGIDGFRVPVLFLDTAIDGNSEEDRHITDYLYGGDAEYRLAQEAVLGIGGVRMLKTLGYGGIERYHMNEGHSSLLALELLRERQQKGLRDLQGVRRQCVFTTHTPVPAGHDQFPYDLVGRVLGDYAPADRLRELGGSDLLNMTMLALNLSHYVNGVAHRHGTVSREMFPGYRIDAVTNGVHAPTWVHRAFSDLFSSYIPQWKSEPSSLRYALNIPDAQVWGAHCEAKKELLDYVRGTTGSVLGEDVFTIGFARRATAYKRADLIFRDPERLRGIAERAGGLQLVFAGKAHPRDMPGRDMIREVFAMRERLGGRVPVVYLQDYSMEQARTIIAGVDLWLNTPRKPKEASGTSGMKVSLNGVPNLSILDGWWLEGCIEGQTGWAIGSAADRENDDARDALSLYAKLEGTIMPMYYGRRPGWIDVMRLAITVNGSFFNTNRMVREYVLNAYYLAYPRTAAPVPKGGRVTA